MYKKISSVIMAFFCIVLMSLVTDSHKVQASEAGFTVSAKIPDNQYDDSVSYFDLLMRPNQTQKLTITVENLVDVNKTLKISPNSSYTANGVNEAYDKYNVDKYSTAKYKFKDVFSKPQTITLKPYETKNITLQVTMPSEEIDGVLEGAIYVVDVDKGNSKLTNQDDFGIRNQFSMALGVVLREHKDEHVTPNLKLRQVRASQHNFSQNSAIIVELENNKAATIGKLNINSKVTRSGNSKALFNSNISGRSVAPNSKFEYSIPMYNRWVNPGKYHLHLVANNGINQWVFDREFNVSFTQALEMNRNNKSLWWIWVIMLLIVLFIVILIITYYLGYRRRRKVEETIK